MLRRMGRDFFVDELSDPQRTIWMHPDDVSHDSLCNACSTWC